MNNKITGANKFPVKFSLNKAARQFSFSSKNVSVLKPLIRRLYGGSQVPQCIFEESLVTALSFAKGSVFYKNVWKEIAKVEMGTTVTYGDIARSLGKPGATRAVALSCSKNPFPLLIPCHRVTAKNGIGGYSISMPYLYEAFKLEPSKKSALFIKEKLLINEKNI